MRNGRKHELLIKQAPPLSFTTLWGENSNEQLDETQIRDLRAANFSLQFPALFHALESKWLLTSVRDRRPSRSHKRRILEKAWRFTGGDEHENLLATWACGSIALVGPRGDEKEFFQNCDGVVCYGRSCDRRHVAGAS